ncbi:hypothetical protein COY07_02580 [Candidatus Peregrinibacteria bacterium CG_4_10_14_0_2_um_filter_43_11]|nr:MAG: hypothetical protein COY07_02580 [Candidatus Peregrinibacteria bacterium CG_4_10_14_0_2_um_filter_43_11]
MQKYKIKLKRNITKLYVGSFLFELLFFIPIMVPFLEGLGLTMSQILTLEASFAVSLIMLEIPSGYFADLHGRTTALLAGSFIAFMGILTFVLSYSFWGFLLGEVITGIGMSLVSGSGEALLYDTLIELNDEKGYRKKQENVFFYGRIGSVISNVTGAILASLFFLRMPFYATLIPFGTWVMINSTLIEPKRHKKTFETWAHFKQILKETFQNKKLRYFIVYAAIPPAFFLMNFWLYQRYMEFVGLPLFYFGIVIAGMNIFAGFCGKYSHKIEIVLGSKFSLIVVPAGAIGVWLALANLKTMWALPLLFIASGLWGFFLPLFMDFLQKMTSSDRRATVISIRSFLTRLIFFAMAPFLGSIADFYTIQTAFIASAILLFIMAGISLITLKKIDLL